MKMNPLIALLLISAAATVNADRSITGHTQTVTVAGDNYRMQVAAGYMLEPLNVTL